MKWLHSLGVRGEHQQLVERPAMDLDCLADDLDRVGVEIAVEQDQLLSGGTTPALGLFAWFAV